MNSPEALYSIQEDSGSLLHGISKAYVKYKPADSLASVEPSRNLSTPSQSSEIMSLTATAASLSGVVLTPPEPEEIPPVPVNGVSNNTHEVAKETGKRPTSDTDTFDSQGFDNSYDSEKPSPKRAKLLSRWTPAPGVGIKHNDALFENSRRISMDAESSPKSDLQLSQEVHHARFNIPGEVFSVKTIKGTSDVGNRLPHMLVASSFCVSHGCITEFFRVNRFRLMEAANCEMTFNGGNNNHDCDKSMHFQLTGTKRSIESAINLLEESLLEVVHHFDRVRALYYLALVNDHRIKTTVNDSEHTRIVFQYCYHQNKKEMKYILCNNLPKDIVESGAIGFVIGPKGKKKKDSMNYFNCSIDINSDSSHPHYVIYGSDAGAVEECSKQMEARLLEAAQYKEQKRRRHSM